MNILDNFNELTDKLRNIDINFKDLQERFLESTIGKIANTAIDLGLKKVLPDCIEDEVIEVKDTLISEGLKEGIDKAVENAVNLGKATLGIFTRNFEDIGQAQTALKKGGLLDGISDAIDLVLNKLEKDNKISSNISDLIKSSKKTVLKEMDKNVDDEFSKEIKSLNKIQKSIENWENYYLEKNSDGLKKEYNKIQKEMKNIMPLENIFNNVRKIQNINDLIKNTDDFNFDKVYLDLANNI